MQPLKEALTSNRKGRLRASWMIGDRIDWGSDLEDVFDQLVKCGAAKGAWPVSAGRIVAQPGAADDLAWVDPLVVTGKVPQAGSRMDCPSCGSSMSTML